MKKFKIFNQKKGFTLLELLIVISIIGVLVALGTVSYSTAQKKSRDSRRKMDMKNIQTAMESYYAQNGSYPTATTNLTDKFSGNSLPKDPKTGVDYSYGLSAAGYCVCSTMEIAGSGNAKGITGGFACDYSNQISFCVQNLQ